VNQGLRKRPEAPWALCAGIAGALAAAALTVKGIFSSGNSTAGLGFVYLPFVAIAAAIPVGIWGAALGHVVLRLRGRLHDRPMVMVAAVALAASLPALIGYEIQRGLKLEAAVREVRTMDGAALDRAFDAAPLRRDRYVLAAMAQNKAAGAALLARIAALDDPALYEALGSLWDVMGSNRKGIEVMRLVAAHSNTGAETLAQLAGGPRGQRLLYEILANPHTPLAVLEPYFGSGDYLAEWGLALNPNTPPRVMQHLAASANRYTRINLTYNAATPDAILAVLANDADELVARNARQTLQGRTPGAKAPQ
jgi:hypothetical protein